MREFKCVHLPLFLAGGGFLFSLMLPNGQIRLPIANRPSEAINLNHMRKDFSTIFSRMISSSLSFGKQGEIINRDVLIENENYVYQIYVPPQIKDGANLPLITFLHGIRERGSGGFISGMFATLVKQYLKEIPAVVVLPQCRPDKFWTDAQMDKMVV